MTRFDRLIDFYLNSIPGGDSGYGNVRNVFGSILAASILVASFGYYLYRKYPDLGVFVRERIGNVKKRFPGDRSVLTRVVPAAMIGVFLIAVLYSIRGTRNVGSSQTTGSDAARAKTALPGNLVADNSISGDVVGVARKTGSVEKPTQLETAVDEGKATRLPRKQKKEKDLIARSDSSKRPSGTAGRELIDRYRELGDAFRDEGQYEKAIEIYGRILSLDKDNRAAREGVEKARKAAVAEQTLRQNREKNTNGK